MAIGMFDSTYLVASTTSMALEPPFTEEEVTRVFNTVREKFPEISNFSKDDDRKTQRINNGPSVSVKKEIYVKSVDGAEVQVVWGPEAHEGDQVLTTILLENEDLFSRLRLTGFDFNLRFDVPFKGNHYEVLSALYYSQETIGRLYRELLTGASARVLDNDVRVLLTTDDNETILVSFTGRTTVSEVASGEYEEKDIRVFFGIQMSKPSLLTKPMHVEIPRHIEKVQRIISQHIAPTILEPLIEKIKRSSGT